MGIIKFTGVDVTDDCIKQEERLKMDPGKSQHEKQGGRNRVSKETEKMDREIQEDVEKRDATETNVGEDSNKEGLGGKSNSNEKNED